ncbi:MAG: gliding motility lipoprotein GldD [Tenacibaculum sp.]|nr:gliding motility lipoprotein GldD [Tenacibaculum sp.]
MRRYFIIIFIVLLTNCNDDVLPKPKGYLSLNYPNKTYKKLDVNHPYSFSVATNSTVEKLPKQWLKIKYPNLKASIDITYRSVKNNLRELLVEAEKLVYEHTVKADQITGQDYVNTNKKVYGRLAEISGNSASQVQFHVTDSSKHFLKASLFFYVKPNYDSILPAVDYIKKDMIKMIETLKWEE